jgi:hypothetical protein
LGDDRHTRIRASSEGTVNGTVKPVWSGQPDAGDWQGVGDLFLTVLQIPAQTWNF